jgi:uncharacterized protein YkwD
MSAPGARLGLAVAVAVVLAGVPPATARASSAPDEVVRLLNAARARKGALPLRQDGLLALAARRHSRDMARHHYFSHDSRTGERFSARIARTGWMRSRARWSVGETLAWGVGAKGRPRSIVAAWLASAEHRRIVLARRYRFVGIGIAPAAPFGAGHTVTADFGS